MKKSLSITILTIILLFSGQSLPANNFDNAFGTIRWGSTMEGMYLQFLRLFGSAIVDEERGLIVARGSFAGYPADIEAQFQARRILRRLTFTIDSFGEGAEAFVSYERSYATLQELFGSPTAIDIFSGDRSWHFDDGSRITLRTTQTITEGTRRTTGSLSGQGTIRGQSRTLGRDGGRTDSDYLLDLNPAHNAQGLIWEGTQSYSRLHVTMVIEFTRPLMTAQREALLAEGIELDEDDEEDGD
ncbi:MAG: hypothetical protein FWE37_08385 [Spirochaetaceae bacterium]|nr:hypothetical protein [Spirochaetaceae bacterium]